MASLQHVVPSKESKKMRKYEIIREEKVQTVAHVNQIWSLQLKR